MERQKFEESFRKSFEDAEVPPSEKVWMNIELDLERLERGQMKKRLTFFKLLAAASVVFALALAGAGLYILSVDRSTSPALTAQQDALAPTPNETERSERSQSEGRPGLTDDEPAASASAERALESEAGQYNSQSQSSGTQATDSGSKSPSDAAPAYDRAAVGDQVAQRSSGTDESAIISEGNIAGHDIDDREQRYAILSFSERPLPPLVKQKAIVPHFPKTEPDQIDLLLASIEMEERAEAERKKFDGERIWTSVGFSAGTFSNYGAGTLQSNSLMSVATNLTPVNNTLASESRASGVAYSVGVNVGGRIAPRWVLQGGLNYIMQNASFMSDAVVTEDYRNFAAAYSAEITKMADASARVVPTAPYSVNNNMEFLSIPVQAGYLVTNRAFGVQLNGGVATDLFIRNTLQPQSGSVDKVTNGSGSDSPYRTVNFSALIGTEFSYRFSEKYRISLNPGLRYPLNSIYKSDVGLSATPLTFDVGLRFRYIFD